MARLESIAVGGYFPTPERIVALVGEIIQVVSVDSYGSHRACVNLVDPCAGDGAAVFGLAASLEARDAGVTVYTVEFERTRHAALTERAKASENWRSANGALHGDAFLVDIHEAGERAHILYLNPPYDLDPVHARLEQRFLERFDRVLRDDGLLVFVVPHYALAASAETLARGYEIAAEGEGLGCYRFPEPEWSAFKQIVLFARKVPARLEPDPEILERMRAWAASADGIPVLGELGGQEPVEVRADSWSSDMTWRLERFDVAGVLAKARPWMSRSRPGAPTALVPHVLSDLPVQDLMFRAYPLATPPRPAHIAAGIASGLFNGRRVSGNGPDLLVKGVFDKEYQTVEERKNKDGEITGVVQVQQPKLVTTVLDLQTRTYRTLDSAGLTSLLDDYGDALMGVMREQCPVQYDPQQDADSIPLAPVARDLFRAQAHAARALVRLLSTGDHTAILLGEIGSGKTSTALTAAKTAVPGGRVLVMCPPHLLTSWANEAAAVVPEAPVTVLEDIVAVDTFCVTPVPAGTIAVGILSRETAKLGHGWESVGGGMCPGCGAELPQGDLAKRRARCAVRPRRPKNALARFAEQLALRLAPAAPRNDRVASILSGRHLSRALARWADRKEPAPWVGFDFEWRARVVAEITGMLVAGQVEHDSRLLNALGHLCAGMPPDTFIGPVVRELDKSDAWVIGGIRRGLESLCVPGEEGHTRVGMVRWDEGAVTLDGLEPGSLNAATVVLAALCSEAVWSAGKECGTPLYQAIPEPRRVPLATYIARRHARALGMFILDEGHEYATDGSAQERAAHRLTGLGLPTILATGSIMNGYAASLFTNMWALSSDFRREFARDERQRFIDRYGYRKRILSEKDKETGKVVAFGSVTDRVERTERAAGDAPGVLPLFLFRHLLSIAVTLHKTDLALDLPPCRQIRADIEPGQELKANYERLLAALKGAIKLDQFVPERSGKLFGQLSELPSYLDRAFADFTVRYPETVDGGALVAAAAALPGVQAKEEWLIETLRRELAEGRNVMVFCWHIDVLPRLQSLIRDELGEEAPILLADKVPTAKRQAWIDAKIVKPKRRIMLANPVCIQTGLNNLVWFATEVWMQNPACNPTIFRQAVGRIDRIGQRAAETRVYLPVYNETLQANMLDLLLRKVAVATSADGLDPESALLAAGAGEADGFLAGLSLGRALWEMVVEDKPAPRPRRPKPAPKAAPKAPALEIDRVWVTRTADLEELRAGPSIPQK